MDLLIFQKIHGLAGQSAALDWLVIFLTKYLIFILAALILILWTIRPKVKHRMAVLVTFFSAGAGWAVVGLVKLFWYRARPFLVLNFEPLVNGTNSSFPSRHATIAFALATGVFLYNRKLGIIAYILALIISLSRIFVGVHWPSDILAGAGLGVLIAVAFGFFSDRIIKSF